MQPWAYISKSSLSRDVEPDRVMQAICAWRCPEGFRAERDMTVNKP